jgi:hypothetical protein
MPGQASSGVSRGSIELIETGEETEIRQHTGEPRPSSRSSEKKEILTANVLETFF